MFVAKSMNRITSIPSQPAPLDVSRRNDGLLAIRSGHRPYDGWRSDAAILTATARGMVRWLLHRRMGANR
jgi:hypothetical protein